MRGNFWAGWVEEASRNEITALQNRRLKEITSWVYDRSPFWHRVFRQRGLTPDDITSIGDMKKVPFASKHVHAEEQEAHPPYGEFLCHPLEELKKQSCTIWSTTGTTGRARQFIWPYSDFWDHAVESCARVQWMGGVRPGDIVMNFFTVFSAWGASWMTHFAPMRAGATSLGTGGLDTKTRLKQILDYRPNVLHGLPSYILQMAQVAAAGGIDTSKLGIRLIFTGGEAVPSSTRKRIEEKWGAPNGLREHYAITEGFGCPAGSCSEQCGMHVFEDMFLTEVIDLDTGEQLGPGEKGELVVTPLTLRSVAYGYHFRTRDLTYYEEDRCSCGRTFKRLMGFYGRIDDMAKVNGVNIFPTTIESIIHKFPKFGEEYQLLIQKKGEIDTATLRIEPAFGTDQEEVAKSTIELSEEIRTTIGLKVPVEIVPLGSLPRYEVKAQNKRIVDARPKANL